MAGKAEYKNKWQKENCDRINLTVPKGKKETIQAHAEARGESVNGFINRAIDHQISQDRLRGVSEAPESTARAGVVFLPSEREEAQETAQNGEET